MLWVDWVRKRFTMTAAVAVGISDPFDGVTSLNWIGKEIEASMRPLCPTGRQVVRTHRLGGCPGRGTSQGFPHASVLLGVPSKGGVGGVCPGAEPPSGLTSRLEG